MRRPARAAGLALVALCVATGGAWAEKNGSSVLPGGDSKKPVNIEAAKLDYFDKERKLVYTGNVVAVQGDSKLKASTLTIFLAPKKAGDTGASSGQGSSNQVQRMYATGPVTLLQKDQIGTGDNCTYEKAQNLVVMTGNVTLSQGPNVTKGDRLEYDTKSGQAKVTGKHVSSMFIPENSNEETQPAAAADTPAPRKATKPRTKRSSSE